ncbi:MAG TPA: hypothetical protein DCD98_00835 [Syntrophomonas sp.]|nr:hypothetical protein [Syntrophomonas sp.]
MLLAVPALLVFVPSELTIKVAVKMVPYMSLPAPTGRGNLKRGLQEMLASQGKIELLLQTSH